MLVFDINAARVVSNYVMLANVIAYITGGI